MLGELEAGLLALKSGETDPEIINTVFRAAHSIKVVAQASVSIPWLAFRPQMESVRRPSGRNQLPLDAEILGLLLRASDALSDHVRAARDGSQMEAAAARDIEAALGALVPKEASAGEASDHEPPEDVPFTAIPADADPSSLSRRKSGIGSYVSARMRAFMPAPTSHCSCCANCNIG